MSDRVRPNPDEMTAIDAVFRPKRVAVLGASADPTKFGHHLVRNLKAFEFPGDVYPISRSAAEICGCRTFPSLHDLPDPVDLVLVSIPVQHVAAGIADAASVSAKAAVVFTAGFQEVGDEGRKLQQDVVASAAGRIRLIGPNCLGIRNFHLPMNASPMPHAVLAPGPIAFISQSGAFGNAAIAALRNLRIGLSKLASIGNMADLTHAHLFRYFAEDEETSVITAFVEGVPDVPFFLDTIAGVSRASRSSSSRAAVRTADSAPRSRTPARSPATDACGRTCFAKPAPPSWGAARSCSTWRRRWHAADGCRRAGVRRSSPSPAAPAWSPPTTARSAASRCRRSRSNCNRCGRSCRRSPRSVIRWKSPDRPNASISAPARRRSWRSRPLTPWSASPSGSTCRSSPSRSSARARSSRSSPASSPRTARPSLPTPACRTIPPSTGRCARSGT